METLVATLATMAILAIEHLRLGEVLRLVTIIRLGLVKVIRRIEDRERAGVLLALIFETLNKIAKIFSSVHLVST